MAFGLHIVLLQQIPPAEGEMCTRIARISRQHLLGEVGCAINVIISRSHTWLRPDSANGGIANITSNVGAYTRRTSFASTSWRVCESKARPIAQTGRPSAR